MKRPSRHPSARIQSAVAVAAVIKITVITQHVKAITLSGRVTVMVSMVTCGAPILPGAASLRPLQKSDPGVESHWLLCGEAGGGAGLVLCVLLL